MNQLQQERCKQTKKLNQKRHKTKQPQQVPLYNAVMERETGAYVYNKQTVWNTCTRNK